ncbi:MAG: TetR/AcrR family transcriptional regulator [Chthoniobacterales bacterium]|nr:TetR/AcrR family transcriptional regulator [Chthoniobacterales bacterium]
MPKRSRMDDARRRIVTAARQHFFAHGFRGVSMDDLAAEVGMSKKTLYAHFESKTDLVEAVLREKFDELDQELDDIVAECSKDVLRGLHELLECMQRQIEEIQPPFVRDVRREAPEIFELVKKRRSAAISRCFVAVLENGRKAGIVRKDFSLETTIEILLGATDAIINPAKLAELKMSPTEAYGAIMTLFLDGVLTTKGRHML